ncbi:hypothetical protein [Devosia sp. 2618]|uniref:hypothetical protein n=1 Tax=Devosia sp. 2618 TaxID=3156454 RepID=UPI0033984F96
MLTAILPDRPVSSTSLSESVRPPSRTLEVTPVAPPPPVESPAAQLRDRPPREQAKQDFEPPSSGTTFAAAVLAGALAPRPETLQQLYARIGTSSIPEASELRLRDLKV